ncbi:MAG: carbohydrate porin [Ginsengibacter sp.]
MKRILLTCFLILIITFFADAQVADSVKQSPWTNHFQLTVISQKHTSFPAKYSGTNSLSDSAEPTATSITATLFLGRKLWKGAAFYFNPEVSGGNGLSFAQGVAGALNGETYRVGEVAPQVFIARAYYQQNMPLGNKEEEVSDDMNQVAESIPVNRITITAGKFAISDFYDDNVYSKDPRTQFFNWAIWANGSWDYPANTRGYTFGAVVELIKPTWALRFSSVAVPRIANFHLMEYNAHAHSETLEFQHSFSIDSKKGNIRIMASGTHSRAPSYQAGIKAIAENDSYILDIINGSAENNKYGGSKYGLGLNLDQEISKEAGFFARAGWNDGKYASWAFTEIDRTLCLGFSIKGNEWGRTEDVVGIAGVINGISPDHIAFLKAGGYGFIIGDGKLNYGHEQILEAYYNANLSKFLWLTFDYQFVKDPAYNKDRGPVNVFAIRGHIQL